jgi:hypothetical protein
MMKRRLKVILWWAATGTFFPVGYVLLVLLILATLVLALVEMSYQKLAVFCGRGGHIRSLPYWIRNHQEEIYDLFAPL